MPLVANKNSSNRADSKCLPGPEKQITELGQRKGLRDVSNSSNYVFKSKFEVPCKHGHKLKDFTNNGDHSGITGFPNSSTCNKPIPCPKSNLLQPKRNDRTKTEIIEDIDKLYQGNVFLVQEYAKHIYHYLLKLEGKFKLNMFSKNSLITSEMRTVLVDWLVDVHVEYHLLQETIHLGVYILDKYIQFDTSLNKSTFQIVGLCSLFIASKYEEMFSPMMEDFIYLCKSTITKEHFFETEQKLLNAVNFNLGRPASVLFLRRFNMAAKADKMQHLYSKYFIDLVLLDSQFCHIKPSLVAASAVYIAMCLIKSTFEPKVWNATMVHYTTYTYADIKPIKSKLIRLIFTSMRSKYDSVKRKYGTSNFQEVSVKIYAHLELLKRMLLD